MMDTHICFDLDNLYRPGTRLFIFQNGARIGLGKVTANNDYGMWVDAQFTEKPSTSDLYYGVITDFIDKE